MVDRVYESGALPAPPSAPATPSSGYPNDGDPSGGVSATVPGAYWFYMITEALRGLVSGSGQTPDHTVLTQVAEAVKRYAGGHVKTITGAAGGTTVSLTVADAGIVDISASAGAVTATLPAANALAAMPLILRRTDSSSNTVTYQRAGTDTVGGTTSGTLDFRGDYIALSADGVSEWTALAWARRVETITANTTWVPQPGRTHAYISGCAAGGGGGGGAGDVAYFTGCGAGGGAGQSVTRQPVTVTAGVGVAVTIGASGAGGSGGASGAKGSAGTAGGNTVFGGITLVGGGGGQAGYTNSYAHGGAGFPAGGDGAFIGSSSTSFTRYIASGAGASSPFGGGGTPSAAGENTGLVGHDASGYGGGGSGGSGVGLGTGAGAAGGNGAPGIMIIES